MEARYKDPITARSTPVAPWAGLANATKCQPAALELRNGGPPGLGMLDVQDD